MSKWEGDKHLQSKYSRVIMETLRILTQKSETRILKCLKEDAERFQGTASYDDYFEESSKTTCAWFDSSNVRKGKLTSVLKAK